MTTATAEKPTCTYSIQGLYTYTKCGQTEWTDEVTKDNYCKHCGGKIKRLTHKGQNYTEGEANECQ